MFATDGNDLSSTRKLTIQQKKQRNNWDSTPLRVWSLAAVRYLIFYGSRSNHINQAPNDDRPLAYGSHVISDLGFLPVITVTAWTGHEDCMVNLAIVLAAAGGFDQCWTPKQPFYNWWFQLDDSKLYGCFQKYRYPKMDGL